MKESVGNAVIPVVRKNGADGEIKVKWRTIDKSAISGRDFEGGNGELVFKHTEVIIVDLVTLVWCVFSYSTLFFIYCTVLNYFFNSFSGYVKVIFSVKL